MKPYFECSDKLNKPYEAFLFDAQTSEIKIFLIFLKFLWNILHSIRYFLQKVMHTFMDYLFTFIIHKLYLLLNLYIISLFSQ